MNIMKCSDFQNQLDEYLDSEPAIDMPLMQQHLNTCVDCLSTVNEARATRLALHNLAIEPHTEGFENRLFATLKQQQPATSQQHFIAGFGSAVAAGLALWFASTLFIPDTHNTLPADNSVTIAMHSVSTVKLMFEVPNALANATLSIQLPHNMELQGYPGQQQLSWKTPLKKGQNILALPILATSAGSGELIAEITYNGKKKSLRLILKPTLNGVYQISPLARKSAFAAG